MSEYLVAFGAVATIVFVILTFLKVKAATGFRDFSVFIVSIMVAIALTFVAASEESVSLAVGVFLYINALWFYGVGSIKQSERKAFFAPSAPRVFIGLLFFNIASWVTFSGIDLRIALIILLVSILLATYRIRIVEKMRF